jgi:predicted DNA binding CopG/RHH family protein
MAEARKKVLIPVKRREQAEEAFIRGYTTEKKGLKQTVSKTIRVTPEEFKAVQLRAIEDGVHYSDVIRAAVCKYLGLPFDKDAGAK